MGAPQGLRLLCAGLLALAQGCLAALPSGYDEELYCPAGMCLRIKQQQPGFVGPRSQFHECFSASSGKTRLPRAWGDKIAPESRAKLLESGHTETVCDEATASAGPMLPSPWKQWDGLFTASDGIEQLDAKDFVPPAFFVRDSKKVVWVVLYCQPDARQCQSRGGSGVPDTYKELAGMFREDSRVRLGLVNLAEPGVPDEAPGSVQIFHFSAEHYNAGIKPPIHPGHDSSGDTVNALHREVLKHAAAKTAADSADAASGPDKPPPTAALPTGAKRVAESIATEAGRAAMITDTTFFDERGVVQLTDQNFKSLVGDDGNLWIIFFYLSADCPLCYARGQQLKQAAKQLARLKNIYVRFGAMVVGGHVPPTAKYPAASKTVAQYFGVDTSELNQRGKAEQVAGLLNVDGPAPAVMIVDVETKLDARRGIYGTAKWLPEGVAFEASTLVEFAKTDLLAGRTVEQLHEQLSASEVAPLLSRTTQLIVGGGFVAYQLLAYGLRRGRVGELLDITENFRCSSMFSSLKLHQWMDDR